MDFHLSEQVRRHFSNPFKGFEGFFGKEKLDYQSARKIRLPPDHELQGKLKSMRLIEFKQNENLEKKAVLIEDKFGNKFVVLTHRDIFKPTNKQDVPGYEEGETTAHIVYGESSNLGEIHFIQKKAFEKPFDEAEKITFNRASKLTDVCARLGIRSNDVHNDIQLSGADVVVIEDFKTPKTVNSELMLKTISFLFGPNGHLNNILAFPNEGQESLMKQIRMSGGKSLLSDSLTLEQFTQLRDRLYANARNTIDARMSEKATEYLVKALMANVPDIIHTHKRLEETEKAKRGGVFTPPPELQLYIEEQLNNKLRQFVESI